MKKRETLIHRCLKNTSVLSVNSSLMTWWCWNLNSSPQNIKNVISFSSWNTFKSLLLVLYIPLTHTSNHIPRGLSLHFWLSTGEFQMWIPVFSTELIPSCRVSNPKLVAKSEEDRGRSSCHVEIIPRPSERKLVISQWLWWWDPFLRWSWLWPYKKKSLPLRSSHSVSSWKLCDYLL